MLIFCIGNDDYEARWKVAETGKSIENVRGGVLNVDGVTSDGGLLL